MANTRVPGDEIPPARYFTTTFSAEDGDFGSGVWYAEFVEGVAQRQFEVYADHVLVAPHDLSFADQYAAIVSDPRYREITPSEFNRAWNRYASERLRRVGSAHEGGGQ